MSIRDDKKLFAASVLARFGVRQHDDGSYEFAGHNIAFAGRADDGEACLWRCDCQSPDTCEHIERVGAALAELNYLMGYE